MNARMPPLVLILNVAGVAVPEYFHSYVIDAGMHIRGNIKFAGEPGILGKTNLDIIAVEIKAIFNAVETNHDAITQPVLWN